MNLINDIKQTLNTLGISACAGSVPASGNCVTISLASGEKENPTVYFGGSVMATEYQQVKLIFRNADYDANLTAAETGRRALMGNLGLRQVEAFEDLGIDEAGRHCTLLKLKHINKI